jgi:4'-phosphopantetheinyl transferase
MKTLSTFLGINKMLQKPLFSAIRVYYTFIEGPIPAQTFDRHLQRLPLDQQLKNARLRRWQDKHAHLYTRLQLMEGLNSFGVNLGLDSVQYDENNRPHIPGSVDFNISHAEGVAICALGKEMRIGVDVERHSIIDLSDYRISMNDQQWAAIAGAEDPPLSFLRLWTKKEAVVKADGRGIRVPLETVYIENGVGIIEDVRWPLFELNVNPSYHAWLACNISSVDIQLIEYLPIK